MITDANANIVAEALEAAESALEAEIAAVDEARDCDVWMEDDHLKEALHKVKLARAFLVSGG